MSTGRESLQAISVSIPGAALPSYNVGARESLECGMTTFGGIWNATLALDSDLH